MAANELNLNQLRRRVSALRKPDLIECLERLGMRKSGNKPELQQRLLDIFEDSYHLVNNGHGPPRDVWRLTAAQRTIDLVYDKLMTGSASGNQGANGACGSNGSSGGGGGPHTVEEKPRGASGGPAAGAAGGGSRGGGGGGTYANGVAATSAAATADALLAGAMTAFIRGRSGGSSGGGGAAAVAATAAGAPAIRCSCGSTADWQPVIQCRGCSVWQHRQCVGLAVQGPGSRPAGAGEFYCEVCRAKRADPFWLVEDSEGITSVIRLSSTGKQTSVNGSMQHVRSADRTFVLTSQHMQKLKSRQGDHQLQLGCLQLNDPVPYRFHWPLGADLRINNVQYRVYSRNSTQKLGANGRDEPANIGQLWSSAAGGRFHVTMQCTDSSVYVMVVLLVKRRSCEEVQGLMAPQLSVRDAVERVRQQLARDDDDELQTGATVVSLRCPILGARVHTPARFVEVRGLACFDLRAFLDSAARTRKWQCPISMNHSTVHSLQIDTYMQRIISALADHPAVMEVEVEADGSWRPAGWRDRFYSVTEDNPLKAAPTAGMAGRASAAGEESSDGEETDEEEELRRAAAAVSAAAAAAAAGQKRKRAPSPDVIDLLSSDEDDEGGRRGGGGDGGAPPPPPPPSAPTRPLSGPATAGAANPGGAAQPPRPAAAPPGSGAAAAAAAAPHSGSVQHHQPLRITIPNRRAGSAAASVTRPAQHSQRPHAGAGSGLQSAAASVSPGLGSAVAAAGAGVLATHRQHLEQMGSGSLPRQNHQTHHNHLQQQQQQQQQKQQQHASTNAAAAPQSTQQQQQVQQPPQRQSTVTTAAGIGSTTAENGNGTGSGGVAVSHRQPVSVLGRTNTVRIRTSGSPRIPLEGQTPPPGVPAITPYQPPVRQGLATAIAGSVAAWPTPVLAGSSAAVSQQQPPPSHQPQPQPFPFPTATSQLQQLQMQQPQLQPSQTQAPTSLTMRNVQWQQQQQQQDPHTHTQLPPPLQQYSASNRQQQQQLGYLHVTTPLGSHQYTHQQQQQQQQQAGGAAPSGARARASANTNGGCARVQGGAQLNAGGNAAVGGGAPYECIDLLGEEDSDEES